MNYCVASDVLVYAPQAAAAVLADETTVDPWIAEAGGIIDAHLRGTFVVPLFSGVEEDVDQYVKTAAAKLTAGLYLRAKMSQKSGTPQAYAERLIEEAMAAIALIKSDLTMIDSPLRSESGDPVDADELQVTIAGSDDTPVFGMGDETTWG
mgnify:CR=1 FL=1